MRDSGSGVLLPVTQWPLQADSEGNQGPQTYNATEAEGANLLARALQPHGGIVMWRAFVYGNGKVGQEELVKQASHSAMQCLEQNSGYVRHSQ